MPRELPVVQIMSAPVTTLSPEATIEEAIALLADSPFSGAPVVEADGTLVGVLDDSDLIVSEARLHAPTTIELLGAYIPLPGERKRFEEELRQALGQTVADVMDYEAPVVGTDATVEDVATLIHDRGVSRVPVVDENRHVVGIVTRSDLLKALRREA
jgi:CBS domain-containing protein